MSGRLTYEWRRSSTNSFTGHEAMSPLQTTIGNCCSRKSYLLFLKHKKYINVLHEQNVELLCLVKRGYSLRNLVSVRVAVEIKDVNAFIPCTSDFLFIEQAHIRADFDADALRISSPTPTPHRHADFFFR